MFCLAMLSKCKSKKFPKYRISIRYNKHAFGTYLWRILSVQTLGKIQIMFPQDRKIISPDKVINNYVAWYEAHILNALLRVLVMHEKSTIITQHIGTYPPASLQ